MEKNKKQQENKSTTLLSISGSLGLIPPQAVEFEEKILGSILCNFVDFNDILQILSAEVFYKEAHKEIFRVFEELHKDYKPIDTIVVANELTKKNKLNDIGGLQYLVGLATVGGSVRIDHYARAVFECYIRRELITAGNQIEKLGFDIDTDLGDAQAQSEKLINDIIFQFAGKKDIDHISTVANEAANDAWKRLTNARNNKFSGIDTGLSRLNKITCGWQPSKLYILAARPSMGKTAMMLHFAKSAAIDNYSVLIFSLEMSGVELANRLMLSMSDLNADRYKSGYLYLNEEPMIEAACGKVSSFKIWLDTAGDIKMNGIHAKAKAMKKKGKCDIIFIDYLQLCNENIKSGRTREQAVAAMSREAKNMAKDLDVPVILLSQLSRAVEDRKDKIPQLSDLRDSGSIEQDADVVMFIWRPEYYGDSISVNGQLEKNCGRLITLKNRDGAIGNVNFRYNDEMTKIYDF
jgi:replicative DNA helicase